MAEKLQARVGVKTHSATMDALEAELTALVADNYKLSSPKDAPQGDVRSIISALRPINRDLRNDLRRHSGNQNIPSGLPLCLLDEIDTGAAAGLEAYHQQLANRERALNEKDAHLTAMEHDYNTGMKETRTRIQYLDTRTTVQMQFREQRDTELKQIAKYQGLLTTMESTTLQEHCELVDNFDSLVTKHFNELMRGKEKAAAGATAHAPCDTHLLGHFLMPIRMTRCFNHRNRSCA